MNGLQRGIATVACGVVAAGTVVAAGAAPVAAKPISCAYPVDKGANAPRTVTAPSSTPLPGAHYYATVRTNQGSVVIELANAAAPCTVNNFVHLSQAAFYDNTPCHRLLDEDSAGVLQCGDPSGSGSGGPGYTFADENLAGAKYPAGTVAMANAGPDTNGSQFFMVFKDSKFPPYYTPFGRILSGLEVLQKIAAGGRTLRLPNGALDVPVVKTDIEKVTISQTAPHA